MGLDPGAAGAGHGEAVKVTEAEVVLVAVNDQGGRCRSGRSRCRRKTCSARVQRCDVSST